MIVVGRLTRRIGTRLLTNLRPRRPGPVPSPALDPWRGTPSPGEYGTAEREGDGIAPHRGPSPAASGITPEQDGGKPWPTRRHGITAARTTHRWPTASAEHSPGSPTRGHGRGSGPDPANRRHW